MKTQQTKSEVNITSHNMIKNEFYECIWMKLIEPSLYVLFKNIKLPISGLYKEHVHVPTNSKNCQDDPWPVSAQKKKKPNQHQHVPLNIAYGHVFSFKQILSVDNHLTGRPLAFFVRENGKDLG